MQVVREEVSRPPHLDGLDDAKLLAGNDGGAHLGQLSVDQIAQLILQGSGSR